jgi:hypothetical protein
MSMYAVFFAGTEVCWVSEREVPGIEATFKCFVDRVSKTIILLR